MEALWIVSEMKKECLKTVGTEMAAIVKFKQGLALAVVVVCEAAGDLKLRLGRNLRSGGSGGQPPPVNTVCVRAAEK